MNSTLETLWITFMNVKGIMLPITLPRTIIVKMMIIKDASEHHFEGLLSLLLQISLGSLQIMRICVYHHWMSLSELGEELLSKKHLLIYHIFVVWSKVTIILQRSRWKLVMLFIREVMEWLRFLFSVEGPSRTLHHHHRSVLLKFFIFE